MHDLSSGVTITGQKLTVNAFQSLLDALAAMHAMFWDNEDLRNPDLGLCDVETFVTAFWPIDFNRKRYDMIWFDQAWDMLFDMVESDVRVTLESLISSPKAFSRRLADYPFTLVHGDFRPGNIAILPDANQLVAFDWQLAGYAPALIDLHWFLTSCDIATAFDGTEYYRQQLAMHLGDRFDPNQWQSMLALGRLAGVLRLGGAQFRLGVEQGINCWRESADSFNDIVREALKWL
jgi:hypothetical protein